MFLFFRIADCPRIALISFYEIHHENRRDAVKISASHTLNMNHTRSRFHSSRWPLTEENDANKQHESYINGSVLIDVRSLL